MLYSSLILDRRLTSLQLISTKLDNTHRNYLEDKKNTTVQEIGTTRVFDFGYNCPFNIWNQANVNNRPHVTEALPHFASATY